MEQPLVSIIIPTKNSNKFLEKCLKSIRNQVYKNIEIIVVDNNSTDRTLETARKYACVIFTFFPDVLKGKFDGKLSPELKLSEYDPSLCEQGYDKLSMA